jgi:putative transposase
MTRGHVEKREFEYVRHGTTCLIANLDVATGKIVAPTLGPTRDEKDFALHILHTVASQQSAKWVFVVDNLTTHVSETLVRIVAKHDGLDIDLGVKGVRGILKNVESRRAFLVDKTHRIRFVYTPKHCSWLNQIECWFSILARRVLRRGSFASVDMLNERVLDFIAYFNRILAQPVKWTFTGKARAG